MTGVLMANGKAPSLVTVTLAVIFVPIMDSVTLVFRSTAWASGCVWSVTNRKQVPEA